MLLRNLLPFYPEDGCSLFLRKSGNILLDYATSLPGGQQFLSDMFIARRMRSAGHVTRRGEIPARFCWGNHSKRYPVRDLDIYGRMIFKK
jgi:hypothetical protein